MSTEHLAKPIKSVDENTDDTWGSGILKDCLSEIQRLKAEVECDEQRVADLMDGIDRLGKEKIKLEEALKKQAASAIAGMQAAKTAARLTLAESVKLNAESNPAAIASEREANALLTQKVEELEAELARYRNAVPGDVEKLFHKFTCKLESLHMINFVDKFKAEIDANECEEELLALIGSLITIDEEERRREIANALCKKIEEAVPAVTSVQMPSGQCHASEGDREFSNGLYYAIDIIKAEAKINQSKQEGNGDDEPAM